MGALQLMIARPTDIQATTRKELKKGVLRSNFLRGPPRCHTKAGIQPEGSGRHFVEGVPLITQFSRETLLRVLRLLDPIWVFQVETAYPDLGKFLQSPAANRFWYESMPAALLTQPEYFQVEAFASMMQTRADWSTGYVPRFDMSRAYVRSPSMLSPNESVYDKSSNAHSIYASLPELKHVPELWRDIELSSDTKHPEQLNQYPLLKPTYFPVRPRNLALGGPFETFTNYRREILGHLHYGMRCSICFESFGIWRVKMERFGIGFCDRCLQSLTVERSVAKKVLGLVTLLDRGPKGVWDSRRTYRIKPHGFWLPQVDELLRNAIGIDFSTTFAKQMYLDYLWMAMKPDATAKTKRQLRVKIVQKAQELWDAKRKFEFRTTATAVERLRGSYIPTSELSKFLFPAHLLYDDAVYLPHDTDAKWLKDPTASHGNLQEARTCIDSPPWILDKACRMLEDLVAKKAQVTSLCDAADEWHVTRIRKALSTAEKVLGLLNENPVSRSKCQRVLVILSKLYLVPHHFPGAANGGNVLLTPRGIAVAKAIVPKLIESACIGCPKTQLLAPRGIDGVVRHVREHHPELFWNDDKWLLIG